MLRIVSTASTAWRSGQPLRGSRSLAAGSRKTRRRTRRPWLSSKASSTGRPPGPAAEAGALEVLAYRREGAAVIGLERQEVVGVLGPDPLGDPLLAAYRVQRDDAAVEVQGVEQLGDGRDLVRLAVDRALPECQPQGSRMRNHRLNKMRYFKTEHPGW